MVSFVYLCARCGEDFDFHHSQDCMTYEIYNSQNFKLGFLQIYF